MPNDPSEAVVDWNSIKSQNSNADTSPNLVFLTEGTMPNGATAQANSLISTEQFSQNAKKNSK